jgi:hypothetical protein
MKILFASILALNLIGMTAASAEILGVGVHIGGIGADAHIGGGYHHHHCNGWGYHHHHRYCRGWY